MSKEINPRYLKNKAMEGEIFNSNLYGPFKITEYVGNSEVHIEFCNTGTSNVVSMVRIRAGMVRDWMEPITFGVGYIGAKEIGSKGSEDYAIYHKWYTMLQRCYWGEKPSYEDVTVVAEWFNFQNFLKWAKENWFKKEYHLDKDLLATGNREYGPQTCCFLPRKMNQFLVRGKPSRGEHMIGVSFDKQNNKFKAAYNYDGKRTHIGNFTTEIEAFLAYKAHKEIRAKELAVEYSSVGMPYVVDAFMKFEVCPTD